LLLAAYRPDIFCNSLRSPQLEILSNTLNIVREMKLKFEGEGDAAVPVKQVEVQEVVKKEEMEAVD